MSFLEKEEIPKVVIVGHVDHGKSSLIGRLMYDLDEVPSGKYEELKLVSEKRGMDFEFAFLLGGLVVTESVFNLNGIGKLFVDSVVRNDLNLLQGLVLTVATAFVVVNLLIDLFYAALDPRIRYQS